MFKAIKEFFTGKKPEAAPEAPYKVDTPAAPVVEVPVVTVVEAPVVAIAEPTPVVVAEAAPAKKPRAKKATSAKPAVKKPRKTK
jgi:hypothetical protein